MGMIRDAAMPLYRRWKYLSFFAKRRKPIGLANELKMLTNGFFDTSYILYDLRNNNLNDYVSDFEEYVKYKSHFSSSNLIENKIYFNEVIKSFAQVPETVGFVFKGKFFSTNKEVSDFVADVKEYKSVILKKIDGGGGIGIFRIDWAGGTLLMNNKEVSEQEILKTLQGMDDYFVSEIIVQNGYANKIYPRTVNTVRILTMISPSTNKPFIASASHRIGNDKSFPVDNCAKGGFTAKVDIVSGRLGKAVSTKITGKGLVWYNTHPDSDEPIEGVVIPEWELIKSKILAVAALFPFHYCVGWDVVIMDGGQIYILEGNDGSDLKLHQVHAPLLAKPEVREFYKYHKVISK